MKKVSKITTIIALSVLLIGICCILYGPINNAMYNEGQKKAIEEYTDTFYPSNNKDKKQNSNKSNIDLERLKKDIKKYNKSLITNGQSKLQNKVYYTQSPLILSDYGIKNNVYGYLQIPKINLNMPIYLGASDYNMSLGAAQMNYSSIPCGDVNCNAVLAGHCGYGYCDYFRYLERLSVGDRVVVLTPFEKLEYKVSNKHIVSPFDMSHLIIQKNKNILTLFTCHPYPSNKYRLVITCS